MALLLVSAAMLVTLRMSFWAVSPTGYSIRWDARGLTIGWPTSTNPGLQPPWPTGIGAAADNREIEWWICWGDVEGLWRVIGVPHCLLWLPLAAVTMVYAIRGWRRLAGRCDKCGYNLCATPKNDGVICCSECGHLQPAAAEKAP
jgi:hypothetical protein